MKTKCRSNQCLRYGNFESGICPKCIGLMNKPIKQRTPIKKVSDKRKKENAEYLKLRAQFLKDNPYCQVYGCHRKSSDIHHKKGRENALLSDLTQFLSVCRLCHTKIELNPLWAKENGYSVNRTTND